MRTQDAKEKPKRQCEVTTVTFPPEMLTALDKEANRTQVRNRSALVRQAVQEFLDRRPREAA